MVSKFVSFVFRFRLAILVFIALGTGFFAFQTLTVPLVTVFDNLWPQNHPYMQLYNRIRDQFGGANIITVVVEAKNGDIFNHATLSKIKRITDSILLVQDVNYYQVYSIARSKTKSIHSSPAGITLEAVMWPDVPDTPEALERTKHRIFADDMIRGVLVSIDGSAAMITASLLERELNFKVIFDQVNAILDRERDAETNIYVGGEPILYGWIYSYKKEMVGIFLITVALILLVLFLYTNSLIGTVLPLVSATVSVFWGLGFFNLLGYNLDPLIMVIPFLISAMTLSHSVQLGERFAEEYANSGDKLVAAEASMHALLRPGIASIVIGAGSVAVVFFMPIPLLQRLALAGCFWVLSIFVSVFVLNPILLSFFPRKKLNSTCLQMRITDALLSKIGVLSASPTGRMSILVVTFGIGFWGVGASSKVTIGDTHQGSPILWPDARYNQDVAAINQKFPGLDQMYVVFEGAEADAMKNPAVLDLMVEFQKTMEALPEIGATVSLADLLPRLHMVFRDDHPKWKVFPETQVSTGFLLNMLFANSDPGDMDKFVRYDGRDANITLYFKDHRGDTVRKAVAVAKQFFADRNPQGVQIRLAGGLIGALAAVNEVIARAEMLSVVLAFSLVFAFCAVTFRSLLAGVIFIFPLAISNVLTFAFMSVKGIGLNVNVLPIAALGIGLGVDYSLYIVSRIKEEVALGKGAQEAIVESCRTAGRGVVFTATTVTMSVITWYFFSSLRFQAEMGLLLALWMVFSMVGAMLLTPSMISLIQPRFVFGTQESHSRFTERRQTERSVGK